MKPVPGFVLLLGFLCLLSACATFTTSTSTGPVLQTKLLPKPVPYKIYTPPGWDGHKKLPMIIYLHDHKGNCTDLETSKIISYLFAMMNSGKMHQFFIVSPESSTGFWWNYYDKSHSYFDFIIQEFIPYLKQEYPVVDGPAGLHLTGVGTSAMAAVEFAWVYPGVFGTVGAIGGYYFDELQASNYVDKHYFSGMNKILGPSDCRECMMKHNFFHQINSRKSVESTRFVLGTGAFSNWDISESNELFRQHLSILHIPYDYVVYHGTNKSKSQRNIIPVFMGLQVGDRRNRGEVNGMPYEVLKFR